MTSTNPFCNDEAVAISTLLCELLTQACSSNTHAMLRMDVNTNKTNDPYSTRAQLLGANPGLDVYTHRLAKYAICPSECFVMAAILIDRWSRATSRYVTLVNVHRLTLAALVTAIKVHSDEIMGMDWYARVGGTTVAELVHLESCFLDDVRWDVFVDGAEYRRYLSGMMSVAHNGNDSKDTSSVSNSSESAVCCPGDGAAHTATTPLAKLRGVAERQGCYDALDVDDDDDGDLVGASVTTLGTRSVHGSPVFYPDLS
eukprot:PhM_4_TR11317/c0_g1_i1/m.99412